MKKIFYGFIIFSLNFSIEAMEVMHMSPTERIYHMVMNAPKVCMEPVSPTHKKCLETELGKCNEELFKNNPLVLEFMSESLEAEYKRIFLGKGEELSEDELREIAEKESELSSNLSNLSIIGYALAKKCKGLPEAAYKLGVFHYIQGNGKNAYLWVSVATMFSDPISQVARSQLNKFIVR